MEWSSDSKSRVEWSSDLEVGWNLEQRKCEMGCPLTLSGWLDAIASMHVEAKELTDMQRKEAKKVW